MPTYNLFNDDNEYIDDIGAADAHDALNKYNRGLDEVDHAQHAQLWQTYLDVADKIDPRAAQLIVARTMAMMGSEESWNGGDICEVIAEWLNPLAKKSGLPAISDQDDAALRFWGSVG